MIYLIGSILIQRDRGTLNEISLVAGFPSHNKEKGGEKNAARSARSLYESKE